MINLMLDKFKKLSMSKGRFFSDKSYKYDTIFFGAKYLYDAIAGTTIDLTGTKFDDITAMFQVDFSLPENSTDSNRNYLNEALAFLQYCGVLEKTASNVYKVLNKDILEFITVSIENAYICQYLVAYCTFKNDGIWDLYVDYCRCDDKELKELKLTAIKDKIVALSASIGKDDSVWALNMVKFPIMVLGLANHEKVVTRTLNVKDEFIEPINLSANVAGTRSTNEKNNFYIHSFRLDYVKLILKDFIAKDYTVFMTRKTGGTNVILYGVPGAGKSWTIKNHYCSDESVMERLVFHPDYTYSDFVGQIIPKLDGDGNVNYIFNPGPFTKIVRKAYWNPEKMFYLVIEEINRGNAPAIFGDIFQLLDRDVTGASEYAITNADIAKVVYGDENHKVTIPSNLTILCTMNTSDQNVFTLDTAFQRRWNMRLIQNKFLEDESERAFAETKILDTDVTWEKFFTEINAMILKKNVRMTSAEDKRLGTHFIKPSDLVYVQGDDRQNSMFAEKVLKYLWDDAFKFNKDELFDISKVVSLEDVIDKFVKATGNQRFVAIFKDTVYGGLLPKADS